MDVTHNVGVSLVRIFFFSREMKYILFGFIVFSNFDLLRFMMLIWSSNFTFSCYVNLCSLMDNYPTDEN